MPRRCLFTKAHDKKARESHPPREPTRGSLYPHESTCHGMSSSIRARKLGPDALTASSGDVILGSCFRMILI